MNEELELCMNQASIAQIAEHLRACNDTFVPQLSERVEIDAYAQKIANNAVCFEALADGVLVGLVAAYCNDSEGRVVFITSVSVLPRWQGRGVASKLVERCVGHARGLGFAHIELEVDQRNTPAVRLYLKHGFSTKKGKGESSTMCLTF